MIMITITLVIIAIMYFKYPDTKVSQKLGNSACYSHNLLTQNMFFLQYVSFSVAGSKIDLIVSNNVVRQAKRAELRQSFLSCMEERQRRVTGLKI